MNTQLTVFDKLNFKISTEMMRLSSVTSILQDLDVKGVKLIIEVNVREGALYPIVKLYLQLLAKLDALAYELKVIDRIVNVGLFNGLNKTIRKYRALLKAFTEGLFYYTGNVFWYKLVRIISFVAPKHDDAYFEKIVNRGNFKSALKGLGIKPISVRKNTAFAYFIEYWLFKGPDVYVKGPRTSAHFWKFCISTFGVDMDLYRQILTPDGFRLQFPDKAIVIHQGETLTGWDDSNIDETQDVDVAEFVAMQKEKWIEEDKKIEADYTGVFEQFDEHAVSKMISNLSTFKMFYNECIPDIMESVDVRDFIKRLCNNCFKLCSNYTFSRVIWDLLPRITVIVFDTFTNVYEFIMKSKQTVDAGKIWDVILTKEGIIEFVNAAMRTTDRQDLEDEINEDGASELRKAQNISMLSYLAIPGQMMEAYVEALRNVTNDAKYTISYVIDLYRTEFLKPIQRHEDNKTRRINLIKSLYKGGVFRDLDILEVFEEFDWELDNLYFAIKKSLIKDKWDEMVVYLIKNKYIDKLETHAHHLKALKYMFEFHFIDEKELTYYQDWLGTTLYEIFTKEKLLFIEDGNGTDTPTWSNNGRTIRNMLHPLYAHNKKVSKAKNNMKIDADYTSLAEVFKALKQSEFASIFKSVIMSLKFSVIFGAVFNKLGLDDIHATVMKVFDAFILDSTSLINLHNLWNKLVDEVIPAVVHADPKYIKPAFFGQKIDIIQKAVACGKQMDIPTIREVSNIWRETMTFERKLDNDDNALLVFCDVLGDMIKFLKTSINNSNLGSIRNIMNDLTMVRLNVVNRIKYGGKRVEPYCVGLWGENGVGKTTFIPELMAELADILGLSKTKLPNGTSVVNKPANVTENDDFLDMVNNFIETLIFDDMGQSDPNKAKQKNLFNLLFQVQSNVASNVPRSDLENKQNQFFNNKFTILTSNFEDYGCKFYIRDAGAFMRRIHMSVNLVMKDPHDRTKGMKYVSSAYDPKTRVRHLRTFEEKETFMEYLKDHARSFIEHQTEHDQLTTFSFCSFCGARIRNDNCACEERFVLRASDLSLGLWGLSRDKALNSSIIDILKMILLEEIIMHYLYNTLSLYSTDWLQLIILFVYCMLMREGIECFTSYNPFDFYRMIYLGFITLLPLHLAFILHLCFNGWLFDDRLKIFRQVTEGYLIQTTDRLTNVCLYKFTPDWYVKFRLGLIKVESYKKSIQESAVKFIGNYYGYGISIGVVYALYQLIDWNPIATTTALGDIPSEEDKEANQRLRDMVTGHYVSQKDDKANSYKVGVEVVTKKRGGPVPNCLSTNVVKIQANEWSFYGFYSNQHIYTCYHPFGSLLDKLDTVNVEFYFVNVPQQKYLYSVTKNGMWTKYHHDIMSFPYDIPRKSVPTMPGYQAGKFDKFLVNDLTVDFKGVCTSYNTTLGLEPAGSILIDYVSKAGLSGSPVFLVEQDGKKVQPVMIGVLSAILKSQPNAAVVSPIMVIGNHTALPMLDEIIDDDIVKQGFLEYKPIKEGIDPKSVLKHLDDCSGIGFHVGHCDRHTQHSETSFKRTELFERAKELIPETDNFDFVLLKPQVVNGVYQNALLGAARQMESCGDFNNPSVVQSAADIVAKFIYNALKEQIHNWEPMSVLDALKGTLITNPIRRSTAMGFPFTGMIKDDIFTGSYEDPMFVKWYADRISKLIENMDRGIPPLNVASSSLKDEILKRGKMTRVFFAGNMDFLVLCRIYLGALMEMFMSNRDKLFAQIGVNAIGKEFDQFLRNLFERIYGPIDNIDEFLKKACWVDSDFEKFDKTVNTLRYAIHIIYWLAMRSKFFSTHPVEMNRLKLVLQSLMNFVVILGKDVFIFRNKLPSGVWATTMIGCLCEVIIEVLQFYFLIYIAEHGYNAAACDFVAVYRDKYPVFDHIALGNYGDDNLKALSEFAIKYYTHDNIKLFASWICMGITPARKHEQYITVKPVTDIMFLKRVPVYNKHLNRLVGVLDIASIGKMLGFTDSVSPSWKRSVLDQARRELAFHGEDWYNKFFLVFNEVEYKTLEETLDEIDNVVWGETQPTPIIWVDE